MATGKLFGRYRITRTLLNCAAGEAHIALLEGAAGSRRVVLKVLRPPATPERVQAFLREARLTAPTLHANVMRAIDFGQEGERCYVALEAVSGATVGEVLSAAVAARRRLSFDFVAALASQVCAGLAHAHTRAGSDGAPLGLIHCDLSPQHLLVCEGGLAKVLGFTMARARGFQPPQTRVDLPSRTGLYLAPEQLTGSRDPDARSDVFSLGAVLWELVAGKPPFAARTLAEIAEALAQPAAPLTLVARDVPLDLADAVARALELDPDARFASADEMRRAFDAVLARRGAHHPTAAVDAEIKALQRVGLTLSGFDAGALPAWFLEGLGFDKDALPLGPLPEGTALEGGAGGSSPGDAAPTQLVPAPAGLVGSPAASAAARSAETAPRARELTLAETPSARRLQAVPAEVSPDDAWGVAGEVGGPAQGSRPLVEAGPPSFEPAPLPGETDAGGQAQDAAGGEEEEEEEEAGVRPRGRSWVRSAALMMVAAVAGGVFGYFAGRMQRPAAAAVAAPAGAGAGAAAGVDLAVLQIGSSPEGAGIWIDGAETGLLTPARLEVEPGRAHQIVLKHPDCVDWSGSVTVKRGEPGELLAKLVRAARVKVTSEPAGAQVQIDDDQPPFVTPGQSGPLRAGVHRVLVRKQGYLAQRREVSVRDADLLELAFPLAPGADVAVTSDPPGAQIWLDGEDTGLKTPATVGVSAGKAHLVAVRQAGCLGQTRRVAPLEVGEAARVDLALEDVVLAEIGRRLPARAREKAALQKKRDEALQRRLAARRTAALEKALGEADAALDEVSLEVQDLEQQRQQRAAAAAAGPAGGR